VKIVKGKDGKYFVRKRVGLFGPFRYMEIERSGSVYWWTPTYRNNATRWETIDQLRKDATEALSPGSNDVVIGDL
jgi:hypothetical protein